ncbi:Transcriptional regulator, ArsR family [hydrothermal vent metagenome]|uniref:Transcriptional regulator, ArsR family n=1 Tax=hydrothermal vent metagenome TaxID=652676 RepID=A0A3B0ZHC9_9ZZZZ
MGRVKEVGKVDDLDLEQTSMVLKALSHPLRLKILCMLGDGSGEVAVQEIVMATGASQSNISQHLSIMRGKGIIKARKDGNRVLYRLGDSRMVELFSMMQEVICDD